MGAVIRALSAMTPAGIGNFQREVDQNYDPDSGPESQGRVLDILNRLEVEGEILMDTPPAQPLNESRRRGGTISEENLTSETHQQNQSQWFEAEMRNHQRLTDTEPTLANSPRNRVGDLTSAGETENRKQNLLTDPQQRNRGANSSSSVEFALGGGETSPLCLPRLSRERMGPDPFTSVSFGGKDNYPQSYSSPFREAIGPPLTSFNFAADVGRSSREVDSTPGEMNASQRRGRVSLDNVTKRDSKRPSERPRDREYHRRFSVGFQHSRESPQAPLGGTTWPREDLPFSPPVRSVVAVDFEVAPLPGRQNSHMQTGARQQGLGGGGEDGYYV